MQSIFQETRAFPAIACGKFSSQARVLHGPLGHRLNKQARHVFR